MFLFAKVLPVPLFANTNIDKLTHILYVSKDDEKSEVTKEELSKKLKNASYPSCVQIVHFSWITASIKAKSKLDESGYVIPLSESPPSKKVKIETDHPDMLEISTTSVSSPQSSSSSSSSSFSGNLFFPHSILQPV